MKRNEKQPSAEAGPPDVPETGSGPVRVQLSRKKGWRMPPNTVKVDRTTKWGNPFVQGKENPFVPGQLVKDKRHAFLLYRSYAPTDAELAAAARAELRGKNLACWCTRPTSGEDACHAAILLELANGPACTAVDGGGRTGRKSKGG